MVVRHVGDITVLDDCYNAGPESMVEGLRVLRRIKASRVAILGDMRELGEFSQMLHHYVGAEAIYAQIRLLVTVGEAAKDIEEHAGKFFKYEPEKRPEFVHFDNSDEAAAHIRELVRPGDVVLVKGSRAMQMEKIVAALTGETENLTHG